MDNLNDLKSIWLTAKTDRLPATDKMVNTIKKYRNKTLQRKILVIVVGSISVTILTWLTFFHSTKMLTTRIGELLIVLAASVVIFSNLRSIKRFYDLQDFSNRDYIKFLQKSRQNQIYFYKKTQAAAAVFCSSGLLFYIFEFVHKNAILSIVTYSLTIILLLILALVVRRKIFNKHAGKLEEMIKRIESLSNQL
jgi:hypothetical protein